jgi:hypothetical protein
MLLDAGSLGVETFLAQKRTGMTEVTSGFTS